MKNLTSQPAITWTLIILMISSIIINYSMRDDLFKLGVNIIYKFQQSQNTVLNIFFYLITLLIDPVVVLVSTFTLIIVYKNKYKAFVTVMFILLNTYLAGVLKAFYADPRPFWAHQKIKTIGLYCPQEYGNPSGHSWFSVVLTFGVLIQYFGLGKKLQYMYISIGIMILVPLSRMYLGAHSLNQVLQGFLLGLIMIFFYRFSGLKQQIQSFLKNFNSQPRYRWKKVIILMHILYILSFIINEQNINPYYRRMQQILVVNIRNKCNKQVDTNHLNFMMLMINSILVNLSTGIGMGYEKLVKSQKGRIYLSGNWIINQYRNSKLMGKVLYYLIELSHLSIGVVPAIITIYLLGKQHQILFVVGNIGAFISGYIYTSRTYHTLFNKGIIRQVMM